MQKVSVDALTLHFSARAAHDKAGSSPPTHLRNHVAAQTRQFRPKKVLPIINRCEQNARF
jgi:hypothetical protein